ncbi:MULTISPECIES: hypothetical protein [unclassified Mesorhizobium]|jgi:hypothetical protein|uniref:hypothetical protein n=1 Tax=unclassified Mesorhizobium TaxID=325217 RepID=UPI001127FF86|nr:MULTISPECIES: hypothetical protein [unclassified Mesorhizobium]MBZ9703326.1 hypothetical protein [Mesorhizobium sp. CO1-1-3]MBZ9806859.1 hypothetical protein [Mesorhizobium sp. ESP-6-2]MBZ9855694.1 hypothetical protein [Mesorhizobium sp. CA13]MBZ9870950.1 hypothetical protein [Mesorhizobium sp. BR1-1-9]MBZ9893362.1 hypothetical protein [Mesorhizobium sp. BR1-1-6]
MDRLTIQDAFEPYYAGRKRFAAQGDGKPPATTDGKQGPARRPPPEIKLPDNEPDSTTEH